MAGFSLIEPQATPDNLGHKRRVALTTVTGQISGTHTNFPVLFTLGNLPSEMFDADGSHPALSGGGDIRFSSDTTGSTLLPCEVVSFVTDNNPALGYAEIWVKLPNVRSSQTDTIYCWYNAPSGSQPAVGAANGRNAVWSDYALVGHDLGTDVTGVNSMTVTGTATSGRNNPWNRSGGARGFGATLGVSTTDKVVTGLTANSTQRTWQFWANRNGDGGGTIGAMMVKNNNESLQNDATNTAYYFFKNSTGNGTWAYTRPSASAWHHIAVAYDRGALSNDASHWLNGAAQTLTIDTNPTGTLGSTTSDAVYIGNRNDNARVWDGMLCEFRVYNGLKTTAWFLTEYNNQNPSGGPAAFISVGTPATP